ncbi:unnamed protein product [Ectocarpus sp. CCAP 1310/34]|nr:unnamed protein product [Ectocarpus sp. CCAP 1310/34]
MWVVPTRHNKTLTQEMLACPDPLLRVPRQGILTLALFSYFITVQRKETTFPPEEPGPLC